MPRDVADTHRQVAVGQREGVVPVAADLEIRRRGQVPGLHLHPGCVGGALSIAACRATDTCRVCWKCSACSTATDARAASSTTRARSSSVNAGRRPQEMNSSAATTTPRETTGATSIEVIPISSAQRCCPGGRTGLLEDRHRDEHGVAGAHAAGDGVGGAEGEPLVVGRGRKHAVGRPRDRAATGDGTAAGLPRVDQVDPAEVGELGDHRLGQRGEPFLRVVHRAHGARRPGEHGEPLAGPDLVVDVGVGAHPLDDDARDAHRHRPRAEPAVPAFRAHAVGAGDDLGAVGDRPPPGAAHLVAVGGVDGVEEAPRVAAMLCPVIARRAGASCTALPSGSRIHTAALVASASTVSRWRARTSAEVSARLRVQELLLGRAHLVWVLTCPRVGRASVS